MTRLTPSPRSASFGRKLFPLQGKLSGTRERPDGLRNLAAQHRRREEPPAKVPPHICDLGDSRLRIERRSRRGRRRRSAPQAARFAGSRPDVGIAARSRSGQAPLGSGVSHRAVCLVCFPHTLPYVNQWPPSKPPPREKTRSSARARRSLDAGSRSSASRARYAELDAIAGAPASSARRSRPLPATRRRFLEAVMDALARSLDAVRGRFPQRN